MALIKTDERKGVKQLLKRYQKKQIELSQQKKDLNEKKLFDRSFLAQSQYIAGVDEAGRGPLAGPVVAAAVILPDDFFLLGLDDSKQISLKNRLAFFEYIQKEAISYHISVIDNDIIDRVNIYEATKLAMKDALEQLKVQPESALIDAVELEGLSYPTHAIIKGDAKSLAIAAASILAKVTRDKMMDEISDEFPMYHFSNHKGYGTKEHMQAIEDYGFCKYHRKSFSPIREMVAQNQLQFELK